MYFHHADDFRLMITQTFVAGLIACLPIIVAAEGAVRTFNCTLDRVCDAAGQCEPESGDVTFRMEPQQLDANGAGTYQLSYDDNSVAMQASSDAGPFIWSLDNQQHTLLINSATRMLWHRLTLEPPLPANTRYLQCTLHQ